MTAPTSDPRPTVSLSVIDAANWRQAMLLEPDPAQQAFLPSNLFSLAQAAYEPDFYPLAIYNDAGVMVGFAVLKVDDCAGYALWSIARFMIDRLHQRQGYGRAALAAIIAMLRDPDDAAFDDDFEADDDFDDADPEAIDGVWVSYLPENSGAAALYAGAGFVTEGLVWNDSETVAVLRF